MKCTHKCRHFKRVLKFLFHLWAHHTLETISLEGKPISLTLAFKALCNLLMAHILDFLGHCLSLQGHALVFPSLVLCYIPSAWYSHSFLSALPD